MSSNSGQSPHKGKTMTKADLFKEAKSIWEKHDAGKELVADLTALLKPQRSGGVVKVEDVTKVIDGETYLECSLSDVYLPATEQYFKPAKDDKGVLGLIRTSKQAQTIKREFDKTVKASEKAIMQDILEGVIAPEVGKEMIIELRESVPDYSSVKVEE